MATPSSLQAWIWPCSSASRENNDTPSEARRLQLTGNHPLPQQLRRRGRIVGEELGEDWLPRPLRHRRRRRECSEEQQPELGDQVDFDGDTTAQEVASRVVVGRMTGEYAKLAEMQPGLVTL
jgi:hypothetical protein